MRLLSKLDQIYKLKAARLNSLRFFSAKNLTGQAKLKAQSKIGCQEAKSIRDLQSNININRHWRLMR
jgi:hypothetical protein